MILNINFTFLLGYDTGGPYYYGGAQETGAILEGTKLG